MKIRLTLECEINDVWCSDDKEERKWFKEQIFLSDNLYIHNNDVGDCLSENVIVKKFKILKDE